MTLDEIIYQLKDLKEHCVSQIAEEGDIWSKDVEALDYAIERLEEKVPTACKQNRG